ncbi:hypothetical protein [Aquimarina muelleri]|uniref:Uncharacterized protein n=1 Tax=Aquimarina muelleri TaxID=279356 RepID=A0A918N5R7_9FLAO|nr:hypothetical protein [Aquimarina muelleri]MCX2763823.1 hypothetical protein [Aquimarina muelleri]GGX31347.1 hypothetical protein GCM10007384_35520 [Aquimarina muelleri]
MNIYILTAGILCFALGIAHSILGEYLIFKSKRHKRNLVPSKGSVELKERHLRILWATWHLASIFGWCIGAILIKISLDHNESNSGIIDFMLMIIMYAMFLASILVLVGTKGKHPGWIVLLIIALLLIIAN